MSATWLIAFIRHMGCPFAEHTIKELRGWAHAFDGCGAMCRCQRRSWCSRHPLNRGLIVGIELAMPMAAPA